MQDDILAPSVEIDNDTIDKLIKTLELRKGRNNREHLSSIRSSNNVGTSESKLFALRGEIHLLESVLNAVKAERDVVEVFRERTLNLNASVNRLPLEVLRSIMTLTHTPPTCHWNRWTSFRPHSLASWKNLVSIASVCHKWRHVALHASSLWCDVTLYINAPSIGIDPVLEAVLSRSQQAPLRVALFIEVPPPPLDFLGSMRIFDALSPHLRRCVDFSCCVSKIQILREIVEWLSPSPSLKYLRWHCTDKEDTGEIFIAGMESLIGLDIYHPYLERKLSSWDISFWNLTFVKITSCVRYDDVIEFLDYCAELQDFEMQYDGSLFLLPRRADFQEDCIKLPQLRRLTLSGHTGFLEAVLYQLYSPLLHRLSISPHNRLNEDETFLFPEKLKFPFLRFLLFHSFSPMQLFAPWIRRHSRLRGISVSCPAFDVNTLCFLLEMSAVFTGSHAQELPALNALRIRENAQNSCSLLPEISGAVARLASSWTRIRGYSGVENHSNIFISCRSPEGEPLVKVAEQFPSLITLRLSEARGVLPKIFV